MRLEPQAAQTKRRVLAIAGKDVSGARPIALKLTGVDRRQIGLRHVTHAPATPWERRWAIVGGATSLRRVSKTILAKSNWARVTYMLLRLMFGTANVAITI